jgi:aminopeptidase-like protein
MSENQKKTLVDKEYHVVINSILKDGSLTYGELIIPGETEDEILISTYLCHPSMANNELSGPVLLTELMKYINQMPKRRYTYRFVINPETIGSITYISKNLDILQQHVKAGFVLSCVGDDRTYSYIATKYGDTLADRVMQNVLHYHYPDYKKYSFLDRGSDERQYGAAGVNLPVCGFCRSKYEQFPEYHTSADNMDLISPEGLQGSFDVMRKVIRTLEHNYRYTMTVKCEPQLGKRGLYPTISHKGSHDTVNVMRDFIAYADGRHDLINISNIIGAPTDTLIELKDKLMQHNLIQAL